MTFFICRLFWCSLRDYLLLKNLLLFSARSPLVKLVSCKVKKFTLEFFMNLLHWLRTTESYQNFRNVKENKIYKLNERKNNQFGNQILDTFPTLKHHQKAILTFYIQQIIIKRFSFSGTPVFVITRFCCLRLRINLKWFLFVQCKKKIIQEIMSFPLDSCQKRHMSAFIFISLGEEVFEIWWWKSEKT